MRKREPLKAVVVTANPEFSLLSERRLMNTQNITVITPDVTEAAEYIGASWRQGVESIIETGKRLIETRDRFKDERGKWSMLIGDGQWRGNSL